MEYLKENEYFKKREGSDSLKYEDDYWGNVIDPDGKKRNRLEERGQHIDDIKQELDFFNSLPGGKILDIGCGLGFFLSALKPEWEKYGLDISSFAAKEAEKYGKIFIGTLEEAKYPDNYFDAVMFYHVIEHLPDPVSAIQEIKRILKPEGLLVLGTPDFQSAAARRFGKNYRLLNDPGHISLFTNDSMHRFLRDYSFDILNVEYPFFETRHFTKENLMRLFDTSKISPPFYGNFMTFYCRKK